MVGYKFMGKAHSHAYKDIGMFFDLDKSVEMKAICGRDEANVKEAAERFGWSEYETDWRALIARSDIDLIDVNAPSNSHKEIVMAAIQAGKHVFCEKPLALNLQDAREMLSAAEKAGIVHAVCFNYRYLPAVQLAKQLIDEGRLGEIHHYRATYLQDWLVDPGFPLAWRLQKEVAGSGSHGDLNAHCVDLARYLIGDIDRVVGQQKTFVKQRPIAKSMVGLTAVSSDEMGAVTVDDATSFLAQFKNGALGTFEATRFATGWKNGNTFEIYGSNGAVRFNLERLNELEVFLREDEPHLQGFRTIMATESVHKYAAQWWPPGHTIGYEHAFIHLIYEMISSMDSRHSRTYPDFYDGMKCQQVLEAVERSIETQSRVHVDEL
ncbi:gfo/Idh/MocA family oxidoreductase [Paenibacillus sp. LMG 31458]|uniref:Gfo/Idh/MocA family oxidoreductase n=1 Tax=Paenibacillus phytorum TaxID=2654977 RepID=A0ABX1XXV3_9BACL|nr:Gfo/Idh/MocA family oxidoreductase [Paenibacillus phytorum]NOU72876.1 gfo/Idh/MocA family oxidoreductase [Paenibacillus phytorum]